MRRAVVGCAVLLSAACRLVGAQPAEQQPKFENEDGWVWHMGPQPASWESISGEGLAMRLDELKDKKLLLTLAHAVDANQEVAHFRPVAWSNRTICYSRRKTSKPAILRFGEEVTAILRRLPSSGPLFPNWSKLTSAQRADRFHARCVAVGVSGVSMHSYPYAWAERAAEAGCPGRYAQQALGHASAAIHPACAKKARAEVPPLEEFEKLQRAKLLALPVRGTTTTLANAS